MSKPSNYKAITIRKPQDIADMLLEEFQYEKKEISRAFMLDSRNRIIKIENIAIGGSNFVDMGIKQIILIALKTEADKVLLVHNHPTGSATPSMQDIKFTDKLFNALLIFEIDLLDHIVIGVDTYTSIFSQIVESMPDTN